VNAQNKNAETPLHKAIFNNSVRILMVNLLLKAGADVNKATVPAGETPLHYAIYLDREDLVSILLQANADLNLRTDKVTLFSFSLFALFIVLQRKRKRERT
jgi:ankyrin repeat protein